jgi:hypothetical protein
MVSWNGPDRWQKWNNSENEYEILPESGDDELDDEDVLALDMSMTSKGHLINTIAILLVLIDHGIITTEEFIEYQLQAKAAVEYEEELGREDRDRE